MELEAQTGRAVSPTAHGFTCPSCESKSKEVEGEVERQGQDCSREIELLLSTWKFGYLAPGELMRRVDPSFFLPDIHEANGRWLS